MNKNDFRSNPEKNTKKGNREYQGKSGIGDEKK
jgi:hypothetical protein